VFMCCGEASPYVLALYVDSGAVRQGISCFKGVCKP
jgi:hypothetical protein